MKKKRDYLKIISTGIALVTFVFILVDLLLVNGGSIRLERTPSIDVSQGWENLETGKVETRENIKVLPGATLTLSRILPENLNDDNVVGYYDYGFRVIAYIDSDEIYTAGWENRGKFGTQSSPDWRAIPLCAEDSGRRLTVIYENDTDAALRLNLSEMRISYESTEIVRAVLTSGWAMTIIGVCFLMTVLLIIFSIVLWNAGFKDNYHRMLVLAILCMTVGFWSWANSSLGQLVFTNEAFGYKISYLSYFLIPMFLGLFYERINKDANKIFYILNVSYRFVLVAVYILYLTDVVPIAQSVFLAHIYLFTELLVGSYYSVIDYKRERSHTNHWALIGQLAFLLVSLIYIPLYYLRGEEHVFLYAGFAFIAFAICMILSQGIYLLRDLSLLRKNQEYRERSKADPITEGNSRTGLSYRLEEIDFKGIDSPWFVVMKIMNFSAINALFGWKTGSRMIRGIYQANESALEEGDYQATVGEAEFAFLLPAEKNVEDLCKHLREGLQNYMKEEWQNAFALPRFFATRVGPGNDLSKILACANLAYIGRDQEKQKSSNVYYFDMLCRDRVLKAQVVENEVNRALLEEKMHLMITPIYDVETGQICQADTYLSWNVKAEEDMFENEFIPDTEKDEIGKRMNSMHFHLALECMAKYPQLDGLRFSVRIFRDCLMEHRFWEGFLADKEKYEIDISRFDFELPLELGRKAVPALKEIIERLHSEGATVSACNFDGSLELMWLAEELGVDFVKFDRKMLIAAKDSDQELYFQIEHLVNMMHLQGQKVCICGVTEKEEVEMLKLIGVEHMEGSGLHRSLPAEAFVELVEGKEGKDE